MSPSARKIRVLTIGKYLPPPYAGIEAHIEDLHLAARTDCDFSLIASRQRSHPMPQPRPYPIRLVRAYGQLASLPIAPGYLVETLRALVRGDVDILHAHTPNPWGDLAVLLARIFRIPTVITWHSDIVQQRRLMKIYRPIQLMALLAADRIVVPTPAHFKSSSQLAHRQLASKIRVVPLGINGDFLRHITPEPLAPELEAAIGGFSVVFALGRHVPYKGFEYLVEATADLVPGAILVLGSDGPLTDDYRQRARALGISHRLLITGKLSMGQLVGLYRRCSVFCLPSVTRAEAFGIATAEAMCFGKPSVVTELGNGVNFLNRDGSTCLTVPPRDPAALGAALNRLLSDPALRDRLGLEAESWVANEFSIARMHEAILSVYRELA